MKILHKEVLSEKKRVRDITVRKNHNFVANGIVVHNCKSNVQKFMAEMKPTSILDIAIATSIHRPGPLSLSADKLYLANRTDNSRIKYVHPVLKEVLDETSGLLIFQEQLQLIANKLSGMHIDDTDSVRKAFTKKDLSNKQKQLADIATMGDKFVKDCISHSGITEHEARSVWDDLEKWTAYGFNKSHAMAYAITSYQCLHGQTRIFDWDTQKYTTIAKAYREGNVKNIACYDEVSKKTVSGTVKEIVRTTGAKNTNLKMAYVLRTSSGKKLVCSKDHPILIQSGDYKKVEDLRVGDFIGAEQHVLSTFGKTCADITKKKIAKSVRSHWLSVSHLEKISRMSNLQQSANQLRGYIASKAKEWWKNLPLDNKKTRILKMQDAALGTNGWSTRYVGYAKCGHKIYSSNELAVCNWFHRHGLEHTTQVPLKTFGLCDFQCKGVFIEFDGIGRPDDYFEKKYGDEPFIKLTDKTQIDTELNFLLQDEKILEGNEVVYEALTSIEPWKETVMYDISMESEPHNFLANNIVVHNCAWFLTYYPDEWITTYLDYCTTDKGKVSGQEDPKSVAMSEARALGYFITKPDINLSEGEFTIKDGKIVPSFVSVKNIGKSVINELHDFRPYKNLADLLVNSDGTWRHRNLNKRALGNLVKLGAFESMDLVNSEEGDKKTFRFYKDMHTALIDHYDELKRISMRKKNNNVSEALNKVIEEISKTPSEDWSMEEKIKFSKELAGTIDLDLIVTSEISNYLGKANILPLDQYGSLCEDEESHPKDCNCGGLFYWAIIVGEQNKKTKTGKDYLRVKCCSQSGADIWFNIWNYRPHKDGSPEFKLYTMVVGRWNKNEIGFSTFLGSLRRIELINNKKEE